MSSESFAKNMNLNNPNLDKLKDVFRNAMPEDFQTGNTSTGVKKFYEENKEGINVVVFVVGLLYLNKRMVRKVVAKEVYNTMVETMDNLTWEFVPAAAAVVTPSFDYDSAVAGLQALRDSR